MITIRASGPIQTEERRHNSRQDGHDEVRWTAETQKRQTERVTIELPQGHVNLEGFAVSSPGRPNKVSEALGSYLPDPPIDPSGNSGQFIPEDEWEVSIEGEWYDWAQQAHRYQQERPDMGLLDALNVFLRWDETNNGAVEEAIDRVSRSVGDDMTPMGELSEEEYDVLEHQLRDLLYDYEVEIPDSYAAD